MILIFKFMEILEIFFILPLQSKINERAKFSGA